MRKLKCPVMELDERLRKTTSSISYCISVAFTARKGFDQVVFQTGLRRKIKKFGGDL